MRLEAMNEMFTERYTCADDNASQRADDNSSQSADDDILQTEVSHVQLPTVSEKYHDNHDDNTL